ncbi:MAG: hypothetical protein V3V48_11695 [Candidatus Aminicenantaceae bacterium]
MFTDEFLSLLRFFAQILAFTDQFILAQGIPNADQDSFSMERLFNKVICSQFGGLHRCLDCSMTGYHDDLWRIRFFLDFSQYF